MPAVVVAAIIGAGATAGATAYSTRKNSQAAKAQIDSANHAADVQNEGSKYAADLQSKAAADALAYTKEQSATQAQQYESAQRGTYDQWAAREARLGSLGESIGMAHRDLPAYVPSNFGQAAQGQPGGGGQPSSAPSAFIKQLLDSGADPVSAVSQTNDKFGLQTGSQAVLYPPEAHGGIPTIGLPDSYLALTNGKWDVTQRGGGGGGGQMAGQPAARSLGSMASASQSLPFVPVTAPQLMRPKSFGEMLGGR